MLRIVTRSVSEEVMRILANASGYDDRLLAVYCNVPIKAPVLGLDRNLAK